MSVERQFSRGVAWMALGNWVEQAVNFAVFVTLARLLGARDYGLLAMASVFIVLCEQMVRESLSEYLIAHPDPQPEDWNATFWLLVALGLALAVGLALIAPLAARTYGEPQVTGLIRTLSLSVPIVALNAVPVAILRRELHFRTLSLRAIAGVVLGGVVGIGMALYGFGVWSFVGQWLTLILTNALLAWGAVDWRPGPVPGRAALLEAGHFGAKVLGLRAGEMAATQVPLLLTGALFGPVAAGLYGLAWRLVETLSFLIITPLRQASQSAFAALGRSGPGLAGRLMRDVLVLAGTVAFPFFTGLSLLAGPMVLLIFGAGWAEAAPVLAILAALGVYICLSRIQIAFALAAGRAGVVGVLVWTAVGLTALLIWIAALLGDTGAPWVAGAVVLANFLVWPAFFAMAARLSGQPLSALVLPQVRSIVGSIVMAVPVVMLARLLDGHSPILVLGVAVPAGVVTYLLFCLAVMRDRFTLFRALARGGAS